MKFSFKLRVLAVVGLAAVICTVAAIVVARQKLETAGERALIEKSRAILSRLEVGRDYVSEMDTLESAINETVTKFPDGKLSDEQKLKILKSVPVFAAFKLGGVGAEKEGYKFRVSSLAPRNPANKATESEAKILEKFIADPKRMEIVEVAKDGTTVSVSRPVRISADQGCLMCHGNPAQSPWRNGKDILGYHMENMKDGELRGMFTVTSSLAAVQASTRAATQTIILWGSGFTLLALLIAWFLIRSPLSSLQGVSDRLASASQQLGAASTQISQVSHSLSANSNEAASSLEETVASIEELSSIVNRNAESAKEADGLSQNCQSSAEQGATEIRELIKAIDEIATSSKKIEEIINVIDDIAFQTNLLALNAAVEAARAGDQGRGFAVVADAVRTLAQRSSSAAKDITNLIKESVDKVERGSKIAGSSGQVLNAIVDSVKKVSSINTEISAASTEQASGIRQISLAMNQLDQATQQNAAAAEQSSASAEEMGDQAKRLAALVQELTAVIQGAASEQTGLGDGEGALTRSSSGTTKAVSVPKKLTASKLRARPVVSQGDSKNVSNGHGHNGNGQPMDAVEVDSLSERAS